MPARLFASGAPLMPPGSRIEAAQVFVLSPEMESFFHAQVVPMVRAKGPLRGLVDALYSADRLRINYDAQFTRNAAEAFSDKSGNCLSLVIMTAAFAKRLGLEVRYQRVNVADVWSRESRLVQVVGHVNIALGKPGTPAHRTQSPTDWLTVDFLPIDDSQRLQFRAVEESRIVAMYMNNRSVEALSRGNVADAYWWSRASIEHDPQFVSGYITFGVVSGQLTRIDLAEMALRHALHMEPDNPQALNNLAGLLTGQGRFDEAAVVAQKLANVEPSTPVDAYKRGLVALKRGDYEVARDSLLEALRGAPDDHEFHFLISVAYAGLRKDALALQHLRLAQANAASVQRRSAYASKIRLLEAAAVDSGRAPRGR